MALLDQDDLDRLAGRATLQAAAVVARAVPGHLVGQDGLALDLVLMARLEGMADAIGGMVAGLPDADARLAALAERLKQAFKRANAADAIAARARLVDQLSVATGAKSQ